MLGPDDDIHISPVRHARGQKLAKGGFGQRPLHPASDHIDIAEKPRSFAVCRGVVDMIGRALLHDPPIAHQGNFIGHTHRFAGFMGHQQDRRALGFQHIKGFIANLIAQAVIKAGKRLVHQHDARTRGQGAGQSHPLLFAPR